MTEDLKHATGEVTEEQAAKQLWKGRRSEVGEEATAHQRVRQRVLRRGAHQQWDASARTGARATATDELDTVETRDREKTNQVVIMEEINAGKDRMREKRHNAAKRLECTEPELQTRLLHV